MKIRYFLLRNLKNQCIPIGTDLFFRFLRREKIFSYTNLLFVNKSYELELAAVITKPLKNASLELVNGPIDRFLFLSY